MSKSSLITPPNELIYVGRDECNVYILLYLNTQRVRAFIMKHDLIVYIYRGIKSIVLRIN